MKQLLIEVDDDLARRLEDVAPGRERKRSEFVRMAIRKAIWDLEEAATVAAYALKPDSDDDEWFDPEVWDATPPAPAPEAARNARRKR